MKAEERFVHSALEEHFRGPVPPDLTDAILARVGNRSKRGGFRWMAAAVLLVGFVAVVLVPFLEQAVPAQDSSDVYLPLARGAEWEYEVNGERVLETVLGSTPVEGREVYLVQRGGEGFHWFFYRAADAGGVFEYIGDEGAPAVEGMKPERVLHLPLEPGDSWEWTAERAVFPRLTGAWVMNGQRAVPMQQVGTVARVGTSPTITVDRKATVVAVDEEVRVPAGTFSTVHVRIETTGQMTFTEEVFYTAGVGVVRRIDTGVQEDLVRYTPGRPAWSWDRDLPALLARSPELGDRGMPDSVLPDPLGGTCMVLQSRFARLRWGEESVLVRVASGEDATLVRFDPEDLEDWNALVRSEGFFEGVPSQLAQVSAASLAELAGRLHAAAEGAEVLGPLRASSVSISGSRWSVGGRLPIRGPDGEGALLCSAVLDSLVVTAIEVR